MESEDLPKPLELSNAIDTIETANELIVLKPIAYDVSGVSEAKLDSTDIGNREASPPRDQLPEISAASSYESLVLRISDNEETPVTSEKANNSKSPQSVDVSPSATRSTTSRYGRVRRQKLSQDFVSVDRKSFTVLNSSYELTPVEETPRKAPVRKNKRSYRGSKIKVEADAGNSVDGVVENGDAGDVCRSENRKPKTESYLSVNGDHSTINNSLISSLNSGTIKTYSRRSETTVSSDEKPSTTELENRENSGSILAANHPELNWKVGDIAWAKIGSYPYWPSIVTLEYGTSIYVKPGMYFTR